MSPVFYRTHFICSILNPKFKNIETSAHQYFLGEEFVGTVSLLHYHRLPG